MCRCLGGTANQMCNDVPVETAFNQLMVQGALLIYTYVHFTYIQYTCSQLLTSGRICSRRLLYLDKYTVQTTCVEQALVPPATQQLYLPTYVRHHPALHTVWRKQLFTCFHFLQDL